MSGQAGPGFGFGNIVVVNGNLVGVIVKSWGPSSKTGLYSHEVYVRSANAVVDYPEAAITRFIYDKELSDEDMEYYGRVEPDG